MWPWTVFKIFGESEGKMKHVLVDWAVALFVVALMSTVHILLQFMRSRVGGSRNGCSKCCVDRESDNDATLLFESRFESGNLAKAVKVWVAIISHMIVCVFEMVKLVKGVWVLTAMVISLLPNGLFPCKKQQYVFVLGIGHYSSWVYNAVLYLFVIIANNQSHTSTISFHFF